jgi:uncharacterized OsmC-like protein
MGEFSRIVTDESPSHTASLWTPPRNELRAVVDETERRCPVFNLLTDAGVELEMRWVRRTS